MVFSSHYWGVTSLNLVLICLLMDHMKRTDVAFVVNWDSNIVNITTTTRIDLKLLVKQYFPAVNQHVSLVCRTCIRQMSTFLWLNALTTSSRQRYCFQPGTDSKSELHILFILKGRPEKTKLPTSKRKPRESIKRSNKSAWCEHNRRTH